ncbi:hypothetical protein SLEP1_g58818 [Rubroshorea leprosula]|uniref:Transposase (putative) gypsy type domain-containing protein n=1 Tax=Rubroshorea leprosula TaxID=152421 RepID=A0AAV5MV35_9ROSI|nr:hypothetical protein SLEP1_g58818 [Rubroshorea leprosula]
MSSEETLSDGRVRGRVEEAENRDLRLPSNILEREDGRELCFNPEGEVVSEVAGYETTLENRGSLAHLVENYGVPGRVLVRPTGSRERACSAPGDHWMPLYSHYLAAGLQFPFPDLLVWLLLEYGLGLTQLTPNAVRLVVVFAVYSRSRGVSFPTANIFKYFYVLNAGSGREKGWYYFTGRLVNKQRRGLLSAGPSSIKRWKDKFFFADDTEWDKTDAEVEHLSRWKAKGLNLNEYSLTPGELEDVGELERGGVGLLDIMEYTSQRMLDAAEIYGPSSQRGEEMNKFLDAASGAGIPKKGRGKRGEVRRRVEEVSLPQAEVENLAITQPGHVGGGVTVAEEGPIVAKRRRLERQEAVEEVDEAPEAVTSTLRLEGTSSASAVQFAAALREQGYIRAQMTSFYDSGIRSTAKRFINTYFSEVDRQRAKDEVAARGSVGVVRQTLKAVNLVNALAHEHHESFKERNQMRKDNAELVKKNKEAEDSEISYQKRKICEAELEKREKELEDVGRTVVELELKVHNSVEEHVEGFLRSSTFEDIVNLYRLPIAIVAFSNCRKKVKLQYPSVDITKITFGEQEGEVEEDGESSTVDFHPEITLKWERDSRGQTVLPPKFSFEFVAVEEEGTEGGEVTEGAEKSTEGADQPSQPTDNPEQPAANSNQTAD